MRRIVALLLSILMLLTGCSHMTESELQNETREFTDSLGRTVIIPEKITKIAVSGPLSQVYILPLAGDMLVGVSNAFAENAQKYISDDILEKAEIGQLYGGC